MKKLVIILGLAIAVLTVRAQQLPMYSQYMFNNFLLNPATAGTEEYSPLRLTARQQWLGIPDAPMTVAVSYHTMFSNKKVGVGGYIFSDNFGPTARNGILAAYSYHLDLPAIQSKLALGISAVAFQYQLKEDELNFYNPRGDPIVSGARQTAIVPDANFGAYLYNPRYFVGLAGTNLIELKMNLGDYATKDTKLVRHYFVTGGYKFILSDEFELEPSLLAKGTEKSPFNVDVNLRAIYKKSYWLGVSYRTDKDLVALVGIQMGKFQFGYAFDWPFSELNNYADYGTHEIVIGYNLKAVEVGSSLL